MTDFIREVDEDLRRERLKALWDRFGLYLIGAVALIVAVTLGIVFWASYAARSDRAASDAFAAVAAEVQGATPAAAAALWASFADATGEAGYRTLARFREAGQLEAAGEAEQAVVVLDALGGTAETETLRGLAKLKAALILTDSASYDDLANRLAGLDAPEAPWRNQVRELLAVAALDESRYETAATHLRLIIGDAEASAGVRARAHVLYALTAPHLSNEAASKPIAAPGAETAVPSAAPAPVGADAAIPSASQSE